MLSRSRSSTSLSKKDSWRRETKRRELKRKESREKMKKKSEEDAQKNSSCRSNRLNSTAPSYALHASYKSLEAAEEESNSRISNLDPVKEMTHHSRCITAIRMSSDSSNPFIVTAALDCKVFVTDYWTGSIMKEIDTDHSFVFSVSIAEDNSVFATGAQDGCVRIYSRFHRWRCQRVIKQQSPGVCRIIWAVQLFTTANNEKLCISGGATKVIHVFDWTTGVEKRSFPGHLEGVRCLAVSEDGILASGSNDFSVKLWDLSRGKFLFTLRGHSAEVNSVCFASKNSWLVSACENNIFRVWNYHDGSRVMIFDGYRGLSILSMSIIPPTSDRDAPWVLVGGSHMKGAGASTLNVEIWNLKTGDKVANCRGCRHQICGIDTQRVIDEDGSESIIAVAGGLDCKTRCWNLDTLLHSSLSEKYFITDLESVITENSIASLSEA